MRTTQGTKTRGRRYVLRPTVTAADARYLPPYEYQCTVGHQLGADRPVDCCPACIEGEPCPGELVRVGTGSRSARVSA